MYLQERGATSVVDGDIQVTVTAPWERLQVLYKPPNYCWAATPVPGTGSFPKERLLEVGVRACKCVSMQARMCVHAGETTRHPSLPQRDSWPRTQEVISRHEPVTVTRPVPGVDGDSLP